MKKVEALITQLVTSRAVLILDEDDNIVEIEELIEEEERSDTELQQVLDVFPTEMELPDHREVE